MDRRLLRAMLAAGLDPETAADVLWLLQARGTVAASAAPPPAPQALPPTEAPDTGTSPESASRRLPGERSQATPLHLEAGMPLGAAPGRPGTRIAVPDSGHLPDLGHLVRALRMFRQIRTSSGREVVDVEATVAATADARLLDPSSFVVVTRRETRQALDAVLIADDGPSMLPWRDLAAELRRHMEQVGAFRTVSLWELPEAAPDAERAELRDPSGVLHPASRIVDPSGHRIVMILTDAVDASWHGRTRWEAVAGWARLMPTVLVQVLPRNRYWSATGIGDLPAVVRGGQQPAGPNTTLQVEHMWWARPAPMDRPRAEVAIPVVALTPAELWSWAEMLLTGTHRVDATFARPPAEERTAGDQAADRAAVWTAADRVLAFDARASEGARRLARLLAGASVLTLPLIRVIQASLAPETGIGDVAEIFISGLLQEEIREDEHGRRVPTDRRWLRFRPGIAELLRRTTSELDEWDLHTVVSEYLEKLAGGRGSTSNPGRPLGVAPVGTADHDSADFGGAGTVGAAAFDPREAPFAALKSHLERRLSLTINADDGPEDLSPDPTPHGLPQHTISPPGATATSKNAGQPAEDNTETSPIHSTEFAARDGTVFHAEDDAEPSSEVESFFRRVIVAYQVRFPDAQVARAVGSDGLRYLEIAATRDREWRRWAVGICPGELNDTALAEFIDQAHRPLEEADPWIQSEFVYDGAQASNRLLRHARRFGVRVRSIQEVEGRATPAAHRSRQETLSEHPPRNVRIGLWGAASSGKTTLMAAIPLAAQLSRSRYVQWTVSGGDGGSEAALVDLRETLFQDRRFPAASFGTTPIRLIFEGKEQSSVADRARRIEFTLDLLDAPGALFISGNDAGDEADDLRFDDDNSRPHTPAAGPAPERGAAQHTELVDHLVHCDGIVLLFDPIREQDREDRDNYAYFDAMINRVFRRVRAAGGTEGGALPHHLSVCITKFDDPRVLGAALGPGQLSDLAAKPGPPRLDEKVARRYFEQLCANSNSAHYLRDAINGFFQPDRVRYYATSSIGLFLGQDGRFSPADYSNIVMTSGEPLVRGLVRPMNVLEPLVSLVTRINMAAG